jgi:hypothetical protein
MGKILQTKKCSGENMKHREHESVARFLLKLPSGFPHGALHARAFLTGNLFPDYNLASYLRGCKRDAWFAGHTTEGSKQYVVKILQRLEKRGVRTVHDCYLLGTLMHYLADSFTHVHTGKFNGSFSEHNAYERQVRRIFSVCLGRVGEINEEAIKDPLIYLSRERARYNDLPPTPLRDGDAILRVCAHIFLYLCGRKRTEAEKQE